MINLDFYKTGDGTKQFWGDEVISIIIFTKEIIIADCFC